MNNESTPGKYALFRTRNGWRIQPNDLSLSSYPERSHVFESSKSLAAQLPRIIDPEEACRIIEAMPKRGESGKFVPKSGQTAQSTDPGKNGGDK